MSKLNHLILFFIVISIAFAVDENKTEPVNIKGKAIASSLLIPGWGQHMLNNNLKSDIMIWADGIIWTLYAGFNWYGNSKNNDAILYAGEHANANASAKSDKYFRALERYSNSTIYNEDIRREAREQFPNDPAAQNNYLTENGYFGNMSWNWNSDSTRIVYWHNRKAARQALTRASFVLGSALLNRLVSAIDCAFFTSDKRIKIGFAPNADQNGIGLIYRF